MRARSEGPGHKYLIQHSAGSGKSNSIAWTAHQLSSLYDGDGTKQFHSVIVVTDRTVLDAQLQDTIYQFEHADGVVGRINNKEGDGSKSEKGSPARWKPRSRSSSSPSRPSPLCSRPLKTASASRSGATRSLPTRRTRPRSGSTARQLKEVLMMDTGDGRGGGTDRRRYPRCDRGLAPCYRQSELFRLYRHAQAENPGAVWPPAQPGSAAIAAPTSPRRFTSTACVRRSRRASFSMC